VCPASRQCVHVVVDSGLRECVCPISCAHQCGTQTSTSPESIPYHVPCHRADVHWTEAVPMGSGCPRQCSHSVYRGHDQNVLWVERPIGSFGTQPAVRGLLCGFSCSTSFRVELYLFYLVLIFVGAFSNCLHDYNNAVKYVVTSPASPHYD